MYNSKCTIIITITIVIIVIIIIIIEFFSDFMHCLVYFNSVVLCVCVICTIAKH